MLSSSEVRGPKSGPTVLFTEYVVRSTEDDFTIACEVFWRAKLTSCRLRLGSAARQIDEDHNRAPGHDEHEQAQDGHIGAVRQNQHLGEQNRPDHAGRTARQIKKSKKLSRLRRRRHLADVGPTHR